MSRSLLAAAEQYLGRGWRPVPVGYREKAPTMKGWPALRLEADDLPRHFAAGPANVGILLGEPSDWLVDVDIDGGPVVLRFAEVFLPPTGAIFGRASRPRSHRLYIADGLQTNGECMPHLELRSTKCQTVFPGSVHKGGEEIRWDLEGDPAVVPARALVEACRLTAAATELVGSWSQGVRHHLALSLAGAMITAGWSPVDGTRLIKAVAEEAGDEELDDRLKCVGDTAARFNAGLAVAGVTNLRSLLPRHVFDALTRWLGTCETAPTSLGGRSDPNSDIANGERFASDHAGVLRRVPGWGWMRWNGKRWVRGSDEDVISFAGETAKRLLAEAAGQPTPEGRERAGRHGAASQRIRRLRAMVDYAASIPSLRAMPEDFDSDPFLLCVENGVVELRTGTLRPHDPKDLMTLMAEAEYDPSATSPLWEDFVRWACGRNDEFLGWLQRGLGYSLTGVTREECFFLCYGSGSNGKSTLFEAVGGVMGDYRSVTPFSTLLRQDRGGASPDVARLRGARLVTAAEPVQGRAFDEARIKSLTGGDRLAARYLYQESFEFVPRFKLWLSANEKPGIRGTDEGIWRRVRLVPFTQTIPEGKADPLLKEKFRRPAERAAILAWLVRGAEKWLRLGLGDCPEVADATRSYRFESDVMGQFIDECCEMSEDSRILFVKLYAAYANWAETRGERQMNSTRFGLELASRGFEGYKGSRGERGRLGIRLRGRG